MVSLKVVTNTSKILQLVMVSRYSAAIALCVEDCTVKNHLDWLN